MKDSPNRKKPLNRQQYRPFPTATAMIDPHTYTYLKKHQPIPRHQLIGCLAGLLDQDYSEIQTHLNQLERDGLIYDVPTQGVKITNERRR